MNRTVKITLIALLVIGVGSYTYLKAQPLVHGPEIQVFSPRNGTMLEDPLVGVTGTAKHISYLHINGRQIFTDEAGQFSEQLLLYPGYNIITITAQDRFHRDITKTLELVYRPSLGQKESRTHSEGTLVEQEREAPLGLRILHN